MFWGILKEEQIERLRLARSIKKFGHLETWQELFIYQLSIATQEQKREISNWARRENRGEFIKLPLKDNK